MRFPGCMSIDYQIMSNKFSFCEITQHYLCMAPIKDIAKLVTFSLDENIQDLLLCATVFHPLAKKFPPSLSYSRKFVKWLMQQIEEAGYEFAENIYLAYTNLLDGDKDIFYQSYIINSQLTVTLATTQHLVNHSTTGLIVWEAAKFLADWGIENANLLKEKTILELGSGLGLTGITLSKLLQFEKYFFSDNSEDVLRILKRNINLNLYDSDYSKLGAFENCISRNVNNHIVNSVINEISVISLEWNDVTNEEINKYNPDIILAADVTYDPNLFDSLIRVLSLFLTFSSTKKAYLAFTERNPETSLLFLNKIKEANLQYIEKVPPQKLHFVYTEKVPMHIYEISS